AGLYYLGAAMPLNERAFYILSKKIKFMSPDDFKGKRIAGSPPYFAFFKGLGSIPQTISGLKDYFSLMERGIIDAHIATFSVFLAVGTYEIGKYMIDHTFFNQVQILIMNLKKWNSLPKHLQDTMNETMVELETSMPPVWNKMQQIDRAKLIKGGIEFYKLPPDVAKWYLNTSIEASWKEAEGRHPAKLVDGYKKYLRR
ncbi:TRAP transporter substrate-binding protein, partial [Thermodesulfobacteriota bacterium]